MSGKNKQNTKKNVEENCDCYSKTYARKVCPPVRNVTHPLRYYEFTQEEMKALEECDKESFYNRCLPISTLFATVTYAAIRAGLLRRNPHFGAYPKVMIAAIMGFFYGRVSYIPIVDQKLRTELPQSSYLGKVLRHHYANANPSPNPKK